MHLLTVDEMAQADRLTMEGGLSGETLMANAAEAVAAVVRRIASPDQPVQIICGPGNNGGDGYAAGAILAREWRDVRIFALGTPKEGSDAAWARTEWGRDVQPLGEFDPDPSVLIVDALFGAGLSRPLAGETAAAVERANAAGATIVAVDIPSGIGGDDGHIHGAAIEAGQTVTFFRPKPGHYLLPGARMRGELHVADIGISPEVLDRIEPRHRLNGPSLWQASLPVLKPDTHKYARGAVAVLSGAALSTGATRLSARAAARIGAGAVTVIAPPEAARIHAAHLTAIMVGEATSPKAVVKRLAEGKERAAVLGPGYGVGDELRSLVLDLLALTTDGESALRTLVLDADALTSFSDDPDALFDAIDRSDAAVFLTPHQGEFGRIFPDLAHAEAAKTERAALAAQRSGAIVLYKGSDTVIASPGGPVAINPNGTPLLATAGAGDVLAGMIAGLAAQAMSPFEAACAATWIHAEAAARFGAGLTADDLPEALPAILQRLDGTGGPS